MPDRGLRSHGMRDLGPEEMTRFRRLERTFLEVSAAAGYAELRMPTIEPLHLYTASGTLSPQALDRVYSFLDWDGWSGERVVLRPDATVGVARWYAEQAAPRPGRLAYVQPVYRFDPTGDREIWQCGVELFDAPAPAGEVELLEVARRFLEEARAGEVVCELAHAGLVRAVFAAAGLSPVQQVEAYDRILEGDQRVTDELAAAHPDRAPALRLLAGVDGSSVGYVQNLRAALVSDVPAAGASLDDLEAAGHALEASGVSYRVLAATARNFEYYTGVTFRFVVDGTTLVSGGRYDRLVETLGGASVPASGWAANLRDVAEAAS